VNADEETLQLGSPGRHRLLVWGIAVAVLVLAGVVAWQLHSSGPSGPTASGAASAAPTMSAAASSSVTSALGTLVDDGNRCFAERAEHLQLGIELTNGYSVPVLITGVRVDLPLGALREASTTFTPCRSGQPVTPRVLDAGNSVWVSAVFDVEVACPAFAPVLFAIDYIVDTQRLTTVPSGFSDLGQVSYSGCASATSTG
jgi:hypothetical protein